MDFDAIEMAARIAALPNETLLTQPEAAVFLRIGQRTLERWRTTGGGPKYRQAAMPGARGYNQRVVYVLGELKDWLNGNTVECTADRIERFATLNDFFASEWPFWQDEEGKGLQGEVFEDIGIFEKRFAKCPIVWLSPFDAMAASHWATSEAAVAAKMRLIADYERLLSHEKERASALREACELETACHSRAVAKD